MPSGRSGRPSQKVEDEVLAFSRKWLPIRFLQNNFAKTHPPQSRQHVGEADPHFGLLRVPRADLWKERLRGLPVLREPKDGQAGYEESKWGRPFDGLLGPVLWVLEPQVLLAVLEEGLHRPPQRESFQNLRQRQCEVCTE